MAATEPCRYLARSVPRAFVRSARPQVFCSRRNASDDAPSRSLSNELNELESGSSLSPSIQSADASSYDPISIARSRKEKLPSSRFQFRSPRYDSGPLHPHRPPPPSDPASRLFVPGPFSLPRVDQTWETTTAPDIMTMCYVHNPPGFRPPQKGPRLRTWDDSSPYNRNRPIRAPRGGDVLRLLRKPIMFRNVPKVERITVHSYVKDAAGGSSAYLHVAGMALQSMTNVRVQTFKSKDSVPVWGVVPGRDTVACKVEMGGENMQHFLGKLIDVVLPRVKDWPGIKGSSGDSSGNITFGLNPEAVAKFPELEVNFDMYPPWMIPGCHITFHTTAAADKDARLLLSALGLPFYGKVPKY